MTSADLRRAVAVMAKQPAAGRTKTRLTPTLSPQQAADVYECFLLDTLQTLLRRDDCTTVIAIDAVESAGYFSSIAPDVPQVEQVGGALGDRLDSVMSALLDQGFDQVFALGSDSPDLPSGHLDHAFTALGSDENDLVLGPSDDGGYYLIGCKQRCSPVVTNVTMSTPQVLADTLVIAADLGLHVALAPSWYDVDTPEDLDRLRDALATQSDSHTARFLASR